LTEEALERHRRPDPPLGAYKLFDPDGARAGARRADEILAASSEPPPLCGLPVSVKDLYGVDGLPTFAGTPRGLPDAWSRDAWLVARLREQGTVFVGKTHTVEMAYGAVGTNPHWGTPRNPWDAHVHRIPGGSSCGAGVSLQEGSALVALGTDTGGSIRIPASMTGTVGHKTTKGRWPTEGVVPLSTTLDTVGALTRSAADSAWFFAAVDPGTGDHGALLRRISVPEDGGVRVGVPECEIWDACQDDIARVLYDALSRLVSAGWARVGVEGDLLDRAADLYLQGTLAGPECRDFLERELPGWIEILDPTVGARLSGAPALDSDPYAEARDERREMEGAAGALFGEADVLALPGALLTPPPVAEVADDLERYLEVNATALRPTCPVSMLGLCAITLPAGLDEEGMPVGLQLVAPGGEDAALLSAAVVAEGVLGRPEPPPMTPAGS
ncbi:MAG: amidase, partial [Gemmatimonadetes bacterium]|nr:amidase [Gemmatimonadota bacterium]NIR77560.1 amidase [Gemmatimonadota bacterium]NIT86106.1 amidase [Gemmatimonadota bacterium]NIU29926.1 amidase [Gemmatimonadota bacterium]NIU34907.1 amidase [Gemmatimonadota bacterium]